MNPLYAQFIMNLIIHHQISAIWNIFIIHLSCAKTNLTDYFLVLVNCPSSLFHRKWMYDDFLPCKGRATQGKNKSPVPYSQTNSTAAFHRLLHNLGIPHNFFTNCLVFPFLLVAPSFKASKKAIHHLNR